MKVLCFDPGESTGWIFYDNSNGHKAMPYVCGGTVKHNRYALWQMLHNLEPDVIVYEAFFLYKTHAKSLVGDTFYTCEIIGIIKLYAELHNTRCSLIQQKASDKKYSGAKQTDALWQHLKVVSSSITNHTYDAYIHLCFYLRAKNPSGSVKLHGYSNVKKRPPFKKKAPKK